MLRSGALIGLVLGACCVAACDSGEDPKPVSTFNPEEPLARQLSGRVLDGTEPVEGALVRIEASSDLASDLFLAATSELPRTASTDAAGLYRVRFAPFIYDLSVRSDRELLVIREAQTRYVEPQLGADGPITGFKARAAPTTLPPPEPGNAVAYFVSGPDARTLTGDAGELELTFRRFDTTITLHALEYVARDGLAHVVREGRAEIPVKSGSSTAPTITMLDTNEKATFSFVAVPPAGYTLGPIEIEVDLGLRTSAALVARVAPNAPFEITRVPGATYTVRARATLEGAVSDTGRRAFDPAVETTTLKLPAPIAVEAPIDDDASPSGFDTLRPVLLEAGGLLAARFTEGVVEHALVPVEGDAAVIRVATSNRTTTLPDVTRMGLPPAAGRYTWTVQHFPDPAHAEYVSGADARVVLSSWTSTPKVIVLH